MTRPELLLRLYPSAWRRRYGDEMAALLAEHRATLRTYVDLALGALDANLSYSFPVERVERMVGRMKSRVVVLFCAFVLFGLGFGVLARWNDPVTFFTAAAQRFPGLWVLLDALKLAGGLAVLGALGGGLPLVAVAVRRAARGSGRAVLRSFYWAVGCVLLFAASTLVADLRTPVALFAFLAGFLILLAVGTVAVSLLVLRADLSPRELRWTAVPALLIVFGMLGSLVAAVALAALVVSAAPGLLTTQDVTPGLLSAGLLLIALASALALFGLRRGDRDAAGGDGPAAA